MTPTSALPFVLTRGDDAFSGSGYTATRETVHGLLRLDARRLVIQWRVGRKTERMGSTEMSTDEEVEPVREVVVPLAGIAGAAVRRRWWSWPVTRLVLTGADLRAFEGITGADGLALGHPAELVLPIRWRDRMAAEEFRSELSLALAEIAITEAEATDALGAGPDDRDVQPDRLTGGGSST